MTQEAGRFWVKHVQDMRPPLPAASERREWLSRRYPDVTSGMRDADEDEAELSRRLLLCDARLKLLEERKKQIQDELILRLGEAEGVRGHGWSFTHKLQKGRVNQWETAKALAAELASARGNPMLAPEILERAQEAHRGAGKRSPRHNRRGE